ncbi:hypothetical protein OC844_004753, partial [Tilletia horrida]
PPRLPAVRLCPRARGTAAPRAARLRSASRARARLGPRGQTVRCGTKSARRGRWILMGRMRLRRRRKTKRPKQSTKLSQPREISTTATRRRPCASLLPWLRRRMTMTKTRRRAAVETVATHEAPSFPRQCPRSHGSTATR